MWFWRFAGFGFLGFLLEAAHGWVMGDRSERKCLLFLPLCPVYSVGGCVCALLRPVADALGSALMSADAAAGALTSADAAAAAFPSVDAVAAAFGPSSVPGAVPAAVLAGPLVMLPLGALGCTAAEYAGGAWYEWCAGSPFWDYGDRLGSIRGRVCLSYSALWGALSVAAAYGVLPILDRLSAAVPWWVSAAGLLLTAADLAASHILLRRTRDRACLRRCGFPRRRRGERRTGTAS